MKNTKRIIASILSTALLILLAACGTPPDNSGASANPAAGAMGRWVEETVGADLSIVYPFSSATVMADGGICQLGYDSDHILHLYRSDDNGATWSDQTPAWFAEFSDCASGGAVAPGGAVYVQTTRQQPDESGSLLIQHWIYTPDGTSTELDFASKAPGMFDGDSAVFVGDDTLAVVPTLYDDADAGGNLYLIDLATGATALYDCGMTEGAAYGMTVGERDVKVYPVRGLASGVNADGEAAVYYTKSNGGEGYMLYSRTADGVESQVATAVIKDPMDACAMDATGNYYYATTDGIYRIAAGGALVEQVVPGTGTTLGLGNLMICTLTVLPNGNCIVNCLSEQMDDTLLLLFRWDETLSAQVGIDALQVWSLEDSATVRAAITELVKENPELEVDYRVALGDGNVTVDDALRQLNTELLAGEGPDVMILDGADYQSIAAGGLLADISGFVAQDTMLPGVADDWYTQGAAYVLPARLHIPILYGEPGSLDGVTTLDALAGVVRSGVARPDVDVDDEGYYAERDASQRYALSMLDVETLVDFTLQTSAAALIKDGAVDEAAVRSALQFVAAVGEHYGMADYRPAAEHTQNYIAMSGGELGVVAMHDGGYEYHVTGNATYGWGSMDTLDILGMAYPSGNRPQQSEVILQPGLVQGAYTPGVLVGVSAGGKLEQAGLLVQTIFSEAVQGTDQHDGLPVRQDVLQQNIASKADIYAENGYTGDAAALLAQVNTPIVVNATLREKFLTHAQALINGTETLDTAASGVAADLALYLAERG